MNLALAIILTAAFFAALICLACCRVAADADARLQPPQHAAGSDSDGLETQVSNFNHRKAS